MSNFVSFNNNHKYSDSVACSLSTNLVDNDTNMLLPQENETGSLQVIKIFISGVWKNHLKFFIVFCDIFCILLLALILFSINALECDYSTREDMLEWCKPFEPVDKVVVDLNFDLLVHCDTPKSCVAYAEVLAERQGLHYNFIIGDEELVYVGQGYQCAGDGTLRLQMLVTRYTWDPAQPVYRVPEEVVVRYSEVLQEGLWCGKLHPNFTVMAYCSVYGEWCSAANIRDQIPWMQPSPLALAHPDRNPWHDLPHNNHPFFAFDATRVYDRHYRLKACNRTEQT